MWLTLIRQVILGGSLMVCSTAAVTQPVSPPAEVLLNLNTAVSRTLEANPRLTALGYQIEAEQGRLLQSGLAPNPQLGVMMENALGSGDFKGIDSTETTLSLAWVLERGKRERRVDAARAALTLTEFDAKVHQLDAAAETARKFLGALAFQEQLLREDQAVALAEQTARAVEKRVLAGRTPSADLARAEAELARMRLNREDIEHELLTARHRLAAQWGNTQPGFTRVSGDVNQLPTVDTFAALLERVDQNPDVSRYLSEKRLREAELRLQEANARPNWQLMAGVRRFEQSDDQALVAGITIPLARRNLNQGRIAEARAQLAMTDANRVATRVQIETQLFAIYQELQHSLHRSTVLREDILPRLERALVDTERAYTAGRYGYFELRVVQAELLEAQTALVESSIDVHRHLVEIERLTGTTVTSTATQSEGLR